jgi:hypothetical protein
MYITMVQTHYNSRKLFKSYDLLKVVSSNVLAIVHRIDQLHAHIWCVFLYGLSTGTSLPVSVYTRDSASCIVYIQVHPIDQIGQRAIARS